MSRPVAIGPRNRAAWIARLRWVSRTNSMNWQLRNELRRRSWLSRARRESRYRRATFWSMNSRRFVMLSPMPTSKF